MGVWWNLLSRPQRSCWRATSPSSPFHANGRHTHTHAALAVALVSSVLCALEMLVFQHWRTYRYNRWTLVNTDDMESTVPGLMDDPACIKDSWSIWFLQRYANAADLIENGRPVLIALGILLRWEIICL